MEPFTPAWAEAARAAMDSGPSESARAAKLDQYWRWISRARDSYTATWALGVRETGRYLVLTWKSGRCVEASITTTPDSADYVLTATQATWDALLSGSDPGRIVMYRGLLLERGEVLPFFQVIYFFIESLATLTHI